MDPELYINVCGIGSPPSGGWYLSKDVEVQRLYYIYGGTGQYTGGDGQMHHFQAGHLYLFPYNLRDHFVSNEDDPIRHLYFDFLSTPPVIASEPFVLDSSGYHHLLEALNLAKNLVTDGGNKHLHKEPLRTHLLRLLLTLIDEIQPIPYSSDATVCQTLAAIQSQYARPLTVIQLAREAGFEGNYFIRRFRSVMGLTPYAYLRNYRLMQARRLLNTGVSMAAAASQVGYESAASLSRALRLG